MAADDPVLEQHSRVNGTGAARVGQVFRFLCGLRSTHGTTVPTEKSYVRDIRDAHCARGFFLPANERHVKVTGESSPGCRRVLPL